MGTLKCDANIALRVFLTHVPRQVDVVCRFVRALYALQLDACRAPMFVKDVTPQSPLGFASELALYTFEPLNLAFVFVFYVGLCVF
jgi:hypothetical protein